jgi:ribulose-5-phosphate 4-epimerase/fuculose-1-phosphate aldolase
MRPDVQAVCHSHTASVIPFSVIDLPLKVVFHTGAGIGTSVPVWDFETDFGLTNMLVSNLEQGRSLARTLGQGRIALMRGHGCVFVGRSIQDIVTTGVYMDMNARMATTAHLLSGGNVHYLSDDEVRMRNTQPSSAADAQPRVSREWEAWCAQIGEPVD